MRQWLKNGSFALIGGIIAIAIEGIIGNQANTAFTILVNWTITSINTNALPWIITGIFVLISLAEGAYFWLHDKVLNQTIERANKLIELDGSLVRGLASWQPSIDPIIRDSETKMLLKEVLRDATTEFNDHVSRAALVLPDSTGEYLKCWVAWQMPQESIESMEFYIGPNNRLRQEKRGIAGEAYIKEKLHVAHMTKAKNGQWTCDHECYTKFNGQRPILPYRSFVNVPIIGADPNTTNHRTKCFGIVCFDSMNEKIFDSDESKEVLQTIAGRIAAAMILCSRLP